MPGIQNIVVVCREFPLRDQETVDIKDAKEVANLLSL